VRQGLVENTVSRKAGREIQWGRTNIAMPIEMSLRQNWLYAFLCPDHRRCAVVYSAGSWKFAGLDLLGVTFIPSTLAFSISINTIAIDERRLQTGEDQRTETPDGVSKPVFLAAFLLPGLDYRWAGRALSGAVPLWLMCFARP